jgi:hypothetical protein
VTPDERRQIAIGIANAIADGPRRPVGKHVPSAHIPHVHDAPQLGNGLWWTGLVVGVLVATAAQSHALQEPWSHVFQSLGLALSTASGYLIRR